MRPGHGAPEPAPLFGERDLAAGAVEQPAADAAFEGGDGLADPWRREPQPFCGAPEVQLLGEYQEHPQRAQLHRVDPT